MKMNKKKKDLSVSHDSKRRRVIGFSGLLALTIGQAGYAAGNVEHLIDRNSLDSNPLVNTACQSQFHQGTCESSMIKNHVSGYSGVFDSSRPVVTLAPTRIEWIQFYLSAILALVGLGSSIWQWKRV